MNLVADIGNTRCKFAVVDRGRIVAERTTERPEPETVGALLDAYSVGAAIVCSTRGPVPGLLALLCGRVPRVVEFSPRTKVPLKNGYLTPETLGCDRLAAAVGVASRYPARNVLVVDFGTAVTVDLVTADGTFCGGCISPGLEMRFRALNDYTARLPRCRAADGEQLVGRTTEEAVTHGVMNSLAFEIEGYIARMRARYGDLCVIFTGGDAKYFVKRIKNTIFANWNPVIFGLERILEYDASEENPD